LKIINFEITIDLGIVRDNPGVFQLNLYPTPVKPLLLSRVKVFALLPGAFF